MGGCEVGGLVNMFVVYMDFENFEYINVVKMYWNVLVMFKGQGFKVVDFFNVIERGEVKFVWIMGINFVVSMFNCG